jgi:signal transduction histidine kinase/ligand-binding sensor domain-containing protein/DNA-binding response OmpR family regulator
VSRSLFYLVLIFLFLLPWNPVFSQGNTLNFENYSQEDGLSNNLVHCSFQDKRGFMWFGTSQGLNRFDGYRFTRFMSHPEDSASLQGNLVRAICETRDGRLLVGTENGGLNCFDREKEVFYHLFDQFKDNRLKNRSVNDILEDPKGRLWVGTDDGLWLMENKSTLYCVSPTETGNTSSFAHNFIRVMTFDRQGNLWMGTNNGIFVLDTLRRTIGQFPLSVAESRNEEIWELITDQEGKIWIGTYDNGIFIVSPGHLILKHFIPDPENTRSRTVRSIARDKKGNYWFGTRGGIYMYDESRGITAFYSHDEREAHSLSGNSVLSIFHDTRGDTWIGTRTGINYLNHTKQVFRNFRAMPGDTRYLNNSEIWAIWCDAAGKLWIGTENGGVNILDPATQTFKYMVRQPGNVNSLSSNCIKSFLDDGKGNLWIGTFQGGINILNLKTGSISHLRKNPQDPGSISDDRVWSIIRDSKGKIWIANSSGVDYYDATSNRFRRLEILPAGTQVNWIREDSQLNLWIGSKDTIVVYNPVTGETERYKEFSRDFLQDREGRIWITTLDKGLALYDLRKGPVRYFGEKEGIANNMAVSVLQDDDQFLWVGTANGLSRFNTRNFTFMNFSAKDGLLNSQFNYGAVYRLPSGELVMGGISGLNIFNPQLAGVNNFVAPVVFTELRILNRRIEISQEKNSILKKSITETTEIVLPFDKKAFTVEFAALNYYNSSNNLYSYFLEGFDNSWTDPSPNRSATYTNLNPGDYVLRVRSIVSGMSDPPYNASLVIRILPPIWKTMTFKLLLFLFITSLFFLLIKFILTREKLRNELVFERLKARKMHELDMLKLRFFTNISHEIRTPLTLILGPIEKLKNGGVPESQQKSLLEIVHRNARHLNQLINQILDLRKLETGNLKIELTDGDLVIFLQGIKAQFDHLAKEKEIEYNFNTLVNKVLCRFDPDKIEKITGNLLSNAFKFTGKGGKISLNLSLVFDSANVETFEGKPDKGIIEISVKDTGRGIASDHLDKIFDRFYQSGEKTDVPGTGIGLSLVKELVNLHNGKIYVNSKPGQGSKFTVRIPFIESCTDSEDPSDPEYQKEEADIPDNQISYQDKIMLVIEDNPDVRLFIRHHFDTAYTVLEASNGTEGWDKAVQVIPDIILCDILMPGINGYDLVKKLKNDEHTSHIPVILITALGSREHELEGLSAGADDYITKPFDLSILQTKIENILAMRQSLKEKYSGELLLQPRNILITSPDERFMKKAIETVEENISDPDLDIEKFAAEVGVSRMQLYRKLHSLTDMTVKEFIRDIRLKRAAQLLLQNRQNVSEIAFAVGFKDLSHFRKCFRQKFGMSASDYAASNS